MKYSKGNIPWNKGKSYSNKKISKIGKERGFGKWNKGKKRTEEMKEKNRQAHLGKKHTKKAKRKMSKIHKGHSVSKETRKKIGKAHKGNKCNFWKGGITLLRKRLRTCFKYRLWRSDIFTRDDFTCWVCNERGGKLEAHHHFKSFSKILEENNIKTFEEALDCEELWNINYGITLCKKCHKIYGSC